ncbi:MAG: TRAP transporter small permease subunit [Proteobacteria bacterium]|nr:TRAP transporter small permease subunit [Pseudomonadota bacterium]
MSRLHSRYELLLEWIVILLMVMLSVEVTAGVFFRTIGLSLSWYDEVASIMLAWLTFYGSALASLKRAHIGFPGLVRALQPGWRIGFVLLAQALVIGFFALLGWMGYSILEVLETDHLVSLPWVTIAWTQSVIPASAVLIIIAEAINIPQMVREARGLAPSQASDLAEMTH